MKLTLSTHITVRGLDDSETFIATDVDRPDFQVQARRITIDIGQAGTQVCVTGFSLRAGSANLSSTVRTVNVDIDDLPAHIQNYVLHGLLDAQEGTY